MSPSETSFFETLRYFGTYRDVSTHLGFLLVAHREIDRTRLVFILPRLLYVTRNRVTVFRVRSVLFVLFYNFQRGLDAARRWTSSSSSAVRKVALAGPINGAASSPSFS